MAYNEIERAIKLPWISQANKRRRYLPPHWNQKLLKLLARKKALYKRMKWKPNRSNSRAYKDICRETQRYERQIERERKQKNIQRIQANAEGEIAIAIRKQKDTRKRQGALDRLTGAQLAPRAYAMYMQERLHLPEVEDISMEPFDVEVSETAGRIEKAISAMERNKAARGDQIHIEMLKENIPKLARTLSRCWKAIGRTKVVPKSWLEGTLVPLFKGKGEMKDRKM